MASNTQEAPVTDADVTAAEQEAQEAQDLVAALEARVIDGDDTVTPEDISNQESLSRFARLRAQFTANKAAKSKAAARLAACEALNKDIQAHAKGEGPGLAKLLESAHDAITAFTDAVEARNATVASYVERAKALDVPEHRLPIAPSAEHGRLGFRQIGAAAHGGTSSVIAGRREIAALDPNRFLNGLLDLLNHEGKFKYNDAVSAGPDLFGRLAAVDAEAPEPKEKYFYRGVGDAIIAKENPFTPEEIKSFQVTEITRKEAWGE